MCASSDTFIKAEKPGSNLITKMRSAKEKYIRASVGEGLFFFFLRVNLFYVFRAIEKEKAEEIQSIEFLSEFVQSSTHQATIQANADRSVIKTTLKSIPSLHELHHGYFLL
jgi:hypothetical protein